MILDLYYQLEKINKNIIKISMNTKNKSRSPRMEYNYEGQPSSRIKDVLRNDLAMLEEQNAILKAKNKQVAQLEDKVSVIVKQNAELLTENEKLSKIVNQKKTEIQIMRNKFEAQSNQKSSQTITYEFEIKKLQAEMQHLAKQYKALQIQKNGQINELKNQYLSQLQSLKKQHVSGQDIYEYQIRKLKDQLQKKEYQIAQYVSKMKRIASQSEYEIIKLKEEKEKLKNQFSYLEADKKNDVEAIRLKLENNYNQQVENLRKTQIRSMQVLEIQNIKLKDMLDGKSMEIEQLTSKIMKSKTHYDDSIAMLKRQNENIRARLMETERLSDLQFQNLREKLNKVHESQIEEIKHNHDRYSDCLQAEISKLEGHLKSKNQQIQQLIKQKNVVRQSFEAEAKRFKDESNENKIKLQALERTQSRTIQQYEEKLKQKQKNIDYLNNLNSDQISNNQKQQTSLKQILQHTKKQLDSLKRKYKQDEQRYKEQITTVKNQNQDLKQDLKKEKIERSRIQAELNQQLQGTQMQLKTKLDGVHSKNAIYQRENDLLKNSVSSKDKQIAILVGQLRNSEDRQRILQKQLEDMKNRAIKKDQKMNDMVVQQKQRLENSFNNAIQSLKSDNEHNSRIQAMKYRQLEQKYKKKQNELDELLKMYRKMVGEVQVLTQQQANKKQLTLKYPGATADLIATKNLFDVFIKTKVLNLCGDAIYEKKQNEIPQS